MRQCNMAQFDPNRWKVKCWGWWQPIGSRDTRPQIMNCQMVNIIALLWKPAMHMRHRLVWWLAFKSKALKFCTFPVFTLSYFSSFTFNSFWHTYQSLMQGRESDEIKINWGWILKWNSKEEFEKVLAECKGVAHMRGGWTGSGAVHLKAGLTFVKWKAGEYFSPVHAVLHACLYLS